jgi:hypothetical protein
MLTCNDAYRDHDRDVVRCDDVVRFVPPNRRRPYRLTAAGAAAAHPAALPRGLD